MNKGIVATGSKEATQAGADILRAGGNAFDTAVAAVFTSMTSEFALTGVGGGGAMMIRTPGSEPVLYDFFVDAPYYDGKKELDFSSVKVDFGDSTQIFHIGKGSAAIPGTLLGLVIIQEKFGVLPLSVVMEPAIHLARQGSVLNKKQAFIFKLLEPIFSHSVEGQELFYSGKKLLAEGDLFNNPDFAAFLEEVSREGAEFFYSGAGADLIIKTFSEGGLLNAAALEDYQVVHREPVITPFMDAMVYSNPAPSAGGTLIIFLLKLLKEGGMDCRLPQLIKAMQITDMARGEICRDPNDEYQINRLLNNDIFNLYLEQYKYSTESNLVRSTKEGRGCTTHVSVLDKEGNGASVTTTNGEGCGYILPGTGIMLNNMLGEEDLNPLGFHKWEKPRRLPTMISPSIILKNNTPFILLGSGGSNRIRSAMLQVIINTIHLGMNLEEAVAAPRIHLEWDVLHYEPGINLESGNLPAGLKMNVFEEQNLFFGGVNAVSQHEGMSDTRRGGTFKIV